MMKKEQRGPNKKETIHFFPARTKNYSKCYYDQIFTPVLYFSPLYFLKEGWKWLALFNKLQDCYLALFLKSLETSRQFYKQREKDKRSELSHFKTSFFIFANLVACWVCSLPSSWTSDLRFAACTPLDFSNLLPLSICSGYFFSLVSALRTGNCC